MIAIEVKNRNPVSQKNYDKIVSSLPLHRSGCTRARGVCPIGHGFCNRSIRTQQGKLLLTVKRLRGKECGRTHALLLPGALHIAGFQPVTVFKSSAAMNRRFLFLPFRTDAFTLMKTMRNPLSRRFHRYFRQRLLSENLPNADFTPLIRDCFRVFSRQFMQIKKTPNVLFLTPTQPYTTHPFFPVTLFKNRV